MLLPHGLNNILARNPSCLILILLLSNEILSKIAKDPSLLILPIPLDSTTLFCTLLVSWGSSLFESRPCSSTTRFRMAELESEEGDLVSTVLRFLAYKAPCCFPFSQASCFQCWRFRKFEAALRATSDARKGRIRVNLTDFVRNSGRKNWKADGFCQRPP